MLDILNSWHGYRCSFCIAYIIVSFPGIPYRNDFHKFLNEKIYPLDSSPVVRYHSTQCVETTEVRPNATGQWSAQLLQLNKNSGGFPEFPVIHGNSTLSIDLLVTNLFWR